MNCILFYAHECTADSETHADVQTYRVHLPAHDIRTKHITTILSQAKKGTELEAGIIERGFGTARILALHSDGIDLCFCVETPFVPKRYRSTIVLAHPRPPVMARLLRDLSTMGVDNIICYVPELGEKSYLNASFWNTADELLLLGAMQGKECCVPSVYTCVGIENALSLLDTCKQKEHASTQFLSVIVQQNAATSLCELLHRTFSHQASTPAFNKEQTFCMEHENDTDNSVEHVLHFVYFIGPERQYSNAEITLLSALRIDSVHIGQHTLRSEVATLIAQGTWNMLCNT